MQFAIIAVVIGNTLLQFVFKMLFHIARLAVKDILNLLACTFYRLAYRFVSYTTP